MPSDITPAWAAIATGAGPEQNGITSNSWRPGKPGLSPTDRDEDGYFPTIFSLIRGAAPEAETAIFTDWDAFPNMFNPKDLDRMEVVTDYRDVFAKALPYILEKRPQLTILNVARTDDVGHESGFDSEPFLRTLTDIDADVGRLIEAVGKTDWASACTFLVVTDHGGVGRSHGGDSPSEIEVPWIIMGPGIIRGRMLRQPVNLSDTSPTIARVLGLEPPDSWIGRPVSGAFESGAGRAAENAGIFVPMPKSSLLSGLYTEPMDLAFTVDDAGAEIRFVVSGGVSRPDAESPLFDKPLTLAESCIVTAVAMKDGSASDAAVISYDRVQGVKAVTLAKAPDRAFQALGPLSLVDGKWGGQDSQDGSWLGFKKDDFDAIIDFGEAREIRKVGLDVFRNEKKLIYLPRGISISVSVDGRVYREIGRVTGKEILESGKKTEGPMILAKETRITTARFLRVKALNRGYVPEGAPKEGEKAVLLVDEVVVE